MSDRKKRIKALEEKAAKRFEDENCICHPWGVAQFHTNEECIEARKIPCPVHGIPRFKKAFITLWPEDPLMAAERHLCRCEPLRRRTAKEQGYVLTPEEEKLADQEYADWWYRQTKRHGAFLESHHLSLHAGFSMKLSKRAGWWNGPANGDIWAMCSPCSLPPQRRRSLA